MFNSAILDLAFGLVFAFLAISLASSAITEMIASFLKLRSTTLKHGIKDLLNDNHWPLSGLALAVYKNALVSPRSDGTKAPMRWKLPAYIDPQHFAHALMQETGLSGAAMTPEALKLRIANSQYLQTNPQLRTLFEGIVDRTANMTVGVEQLQDKINDLPANLPANLPDILRDIVKRTQDQSGDPKELRDRIGTLQDIGLCNTLNAIVDRTANIVGPATDPTAIKARIAAVVQDEQLQKLLNGVVDRTAGNAEKIADELGHWFDSAMDRVGGVYKRMSQWISLVVALVLVAILNISEIHVAERLWKQPIDTAKIAQVKAEDIKDPQAAKLFLDKLNEVEALSSSIGWQNLETVRTFGADLLAGGFNAWTLVLGWVITASASLFGAPFWYDALQQIIRLKGTGPSPSEKTQNKGAAA